MNQKTASEEAVIGGASGTESSPGIATCDDSIPNGACRIVDLTVRHLGDVEFSGRAMFNNDAAGYAKITKGARRVEVVFEREYTDVPIINATLTTDTTPGESPSGDTPGVDDGELDLSAEALAQAEERLLDAGYQYIVSRKTESGFTIVLNKPAEEDLIMSWTAVGVKDAKVAVSDDATVVEEEKEPEPGPANDQ